MKNINPWIVAQVIYIGCWINLMIAANIAATNGTASIHRYDAFTVAGLDVIYAMVIFGLPFIFGMKAAQRK